MDVALVDRAAAGDADAFEALIRPRLPTIYRMCLGLLANQADAADATQEALVAAWRQLPRLRDAASFDPWLRRIAYNACRMALRHRGSVREVSVDALPETPHAQLETGGDASLSEAFAALPLEQRAILVLHHLDGSSVAEIAALLDIPAGTVKSRAVRGSPGPRCGLRRRRAGMSDRRPAPPPEVLPNGPLRALVEAATRGDPPVDLLERTMTRVRTTSQARPCDFTDARRHGR